MIVHYSTLSKLKKDCLINNSFLKLYKKFCPGPITFVLELKKNSKISKNITNNKKTLAVRFPKHKVLNNSISINKHSRLISNNPNNKMINELDKYFSILRDIQIDLPENQVAIKNGILREFCRLLFNEENRIEVSLINDTVYYRAIEILKDKNEYYRLLGY